MLLTTLIALSTAMPMAVLLTSNPATLSIWLILSAATLSLAMSTFSIPWFGLILFLIYIGGMLVMFSYFIVIQPNQHLEMKSLMYTTITTTIILATFFLYQPKTITLTSTIKPLSPFLLMLPPTIIILLILAIVLFLALVAAVKITNLYEGPLRPFS